MGDVYRVAWEEGNQPEQHAIDYLTETAAIVRMASLEAAGISRRVMYRTEGDGLRGCWCETHQKSRETEVGQARVPDSAGEAS